MLIRRMTASILQRQRPSSTYFRGSNNNKQRLTVAAPFSTTTTKTTKAKDDATATVTTALKPWKQSVVACRGDYRQEAWLEHHVGGPLYEHQSTLPRLPVCDVEDTLARFLPTALPLARDAEEEADLLEAARQFPRQAAQLQERLLHRARDWQDSSWLQHWWNTMGYLQVRDSVVVNVSYFFDFVDDRSATTQTQRGAALLHASACFRNQIVSGQRPADAVGRHKTPLCSTAYKYMFHACRIPELSEDSVNIYDPALYPHAVVSRKGLFYRMELVDPQTQRPYSVDVLERDLIEIRDAADALTAAPQQQQYPRLGWLTSGPRDDWAIDRQVLLEAGGEPMAHALETLESGAVLLCLDDAAPVSKREAALLYLHGGTNDTSPSNRWFDKSLQLTVTDNAKAGYTGEHSLMDGMPCVAYADFVTKMTYDQCKANPNAIDSAPANRPRHIFQEAFDGMSDWNALDAVVEKAKTYFREFTSSFSLDTESFHGYGSDFIKKAGYSPDAYVQMAMQVATYRLWNGQQGGTYEATQVRPFLHGRTETTRTVSTESAAFCDRMGVRPLQDEDDAVARKEKLQLLQDAVNSHVKYIGMAAKAQGVDRHFMGLSLLVQPGEEMPALYSDPVFQRSKRWRVSTSHLTHSHFQNWGYGPVVDDGVGLSYSIHKRHCVFNVTAHAEHQWTDKLCTLLEEAMLEMRTLVELEMAANSTTQSKL